VDDALEPDDTYALAKAVSFGTGWASFRGTVSGRLCTAEDDWRSLTAPAGSVIAADVTNSASSGLVYQAHGADNTASLITPQTVAGGATARVLATTTANGAQHLRFAPAGTNAVLYSAAVSLYAPDNCPHDFPIDFTSTPITDNDTPTTAMVAFSTQRGITYQQMAACGGDADWYRYNLFLGTNLIFRLWYPNDVSEITVEAFESNGTAPAVPGLNLTATGDGVNSPTREYTLPNPDSSRDIFIKVTKGTGAAPWVEYRAYSIR
jgi:hypothetical protein